MHSKSLQARELPRAQLHVTCRGLLLFLFTCSTRYVKRGSAVPSWPATTLWPASYLCLVKVVLCSLHFRRLSSSARYDACASRVHPCRRIRGIIFSLPGAAPTSLNRCFVGSGGRKFGTGGNEAESLMISDDLSQLEGSQV